MKKSDIKETNTYIGERLKKFRSSAGLKQSDIAAEAGCSANFVSMIETGKSSASAYMIMVYSRLTGVTPSALLGADEKMDTIHDTALLLKSEVTKHIEEILKLSEKK